MRSSKAKKSELCKDMYHQLSEEDIEKGQEAEDSERRIYFKFDKGSPPVPFCGHPFRIEKVERRVCRFGPLRKIHHRKKQVSWMRMKFVLKVECLSVD